MSDIDRQQLIASRIREARKLAGLSQGQVAQLMGMHRESITAIELSNRKVSAAELSQMAAIFDVSLGYLTGEAPDRLTQDDPRLQLAARELSKLSSDALSSLMRALAAVQSEDPKSKK